MGLFLSVVIIGFGNICWGDETFLEPVLAGKFSNFGTLSFSVIILNNYWIVYKNAILIN